MVGQASYSLINPLMSTLKPQSNGPLYSNTVIGTLAVDGWAVTFGTARRGLGGLRQSPPRCTNQRPINGQCINFILFDVALYIPVPIKGLNPRLRGLYAMATSFCLSVRPSPEIRGGGSLSYRPIDPCFCKPRPLPVTERSSDRPIA